MGERLELFTPMHTQTKRDYVARLLDDKVACMKRAREYELDYWDGDRRFGYGGYHYQPGRWRPMAEQLISRYDLKPGDSVMDVGCGKGFLLYELQLLMPGLDLHGMDRSEHAIRNAHPELKAALRIQRFQDFDAEHHRMYDLSVSLGMFHNLTLQELSRALHRFQWVSRHAYLMVESFRDEQEWFNLTAWCLTAETIMKPEDWCYLFSHFGYHGDYEFIFFQ